MLLALVAFAAAALAGPAEAKKSPRCGEQIVDDWYDNGRIDLVYPLRCYRDAIKILPPDVKVYSTAKEEIERALADATNRAPVKVATPIDDVPCKKGETCLYGSESGGGNGSGGNGSGSDGGPAPTGLNNPPEAVGETDTSGPSSVPIPLIVLGGLALLLLAAGSAGYLARRFGHGGDDDEPPAAA